MIWKDDPVTLAAYAKDNDTVIARSNVRPIDGDNPNMRAFQELLDIVDIQGSQETGELDPGESSTKDPGESSTKRDSSSSEFALDLLSDLATVILSFSKMLKTQEALLS